MVVDIVYELEDLLEDDDGYGGDRDEGESKSSRSFREDAARLERRAAAAFSAGDDSEFSHEHAALHDEFRELVEARVEATLGERRFTPSQFVARLKHSPAPQHRCSGSSSNGSSGRWCHRARSGQRSIAPSTNVRTG